MIFFASHFLLCLIYLMSIKFPCNNLFVQSMNCTFRQCFMTKFIDALTTKHKVKICRCIRMFKYPRNILSSVSHILKIYPENRTDRTNYPQVACHIGVKLTLHQVRNINNHRYRFPISMLTINTKLKKMQISHKSKIFDRDTGRMDPIYSVLPDQISKYS